MPTWPLRVGSDELAPVSWGPRTTVHLAARASEVRENGPHGSDLPVDVLSARPLSGHPGWDPAQWKPRALCGRSWSEVGLDGDVDPLGAQRHLLCQSCWLIVEGRLQPPPASDGEDTVAAWLLRTVLQFGEAMLEGVPVPRMQSLRARVRSDIKAAVGGSVTTRTIGPTTLWVSSGLVNGAKTPERWQAEMRAGMERMEAAGRGEVLAPAAWRRHWSEVTEAG